MIDEELEQLLLLALRNTDVSMSSYHGKRLMIAFRSAKALTDFLRLLTPEENDKCKARDWTVTITIE